MDHGSVIGTCSSCHDGAIATGKSVTHINSSSTCVDCHNSSAWSPVAQMDQWCLRSSVIGTCNSCHDGAIATGKSITHINSSGTCDSGTCHNSTAWSPVAQMDHGSVIGTCSSCHDGAIATGKSATHINSSSTCDDCHNSVQHGHR